MLRQKFQLEHSCKCDVRLGVAILTQADRTGRGPDDEAERKNDEETR